MRGIRPGVRRSGAVVAAVSGTVAVIVLLATVRSTFAVVVAVTVAVGVVGVGTWMLTRAVDPEDARWMWWAVALTAAAHVAIAVVINSSENLIDTFGGDARTYHTAAAQITDHWKHGEPMPTYIAGGKEGFFYGLAAIYWLLGPHRLAATLLSVLVATLVIPLTADTARRLFGPSVYRPAALLVAVLPGFLIWTSQLLREGAILLCLALALNIAVRLNERTEPTLVLGLAATMSLLFTLRASVALLVLVGLVTALAFTRRDVIAGAFTSAAAVGIVVVVVFAGGIGLAGFNVMASADLDRLQVVRLDLATSADSGFSEDADLSTVPGLLAFLPIGVVNLALGPFPWQATNARQFGGVFDAMILWFFLPSLWRGWRESRHRIGRTRYVMALPVVLMTIGLALLLGNYGAIVRERVQITVFLVPLVALGWVIRTPRLRTPRPAATEA